jgi:hypothetical protein
LPDDATNSQMKAGLKKRSSSRGQGKKRAAASRPFSCLAFCVREPLTTTPFRDDLAMATAVKRT